MVIDYTTEVISDNRFEKRETKARKNEADESEYEGSDQNSGQDLSNRSEGESFFF